MLSLDGEKIGKNMIRRFGIERIDDSETIISEIFTNFSEFTYK